MGFGTWPFAGRDCEEGVADALAAGYRHVDNAAMYGNAEEVGRGLWASGVDRSEVWLTTKVWPDDLEPRRVRASLEGSLRRLGAKASTPERRRENLAALDLELSEEERARIDALPKDRRWVETQWAPEWD